LVIRCPFLGDLFEDRDDFGQGHWLVADAVEGCKRLVGVASHADNRNTGGSSAHPSGNLGTVRVQVNVNQDNAVAVWSFG